MYTNEDYIAEKNLMTKQERMIQERFEHLINILILYKQEKKDEDVYLYDNGTPLRDIMHVDDICEAINLVCDKGKVNEIYNIGSGHPTRIYDIISLAKHYLNSHSKIKSREAPDFHKLVQAKDFYLDVTKLRSLGFKKRISTSEIVKELCTN